MTEDEFEFFLSGAVSSYKSPFSTENCQVVQGTATFRDMGIQRNTCGLVVRVSDGTEFLVSIAIRERKNRDRRVTNGYH